MLSSKNYRQILWHKRKINTCFMKIKYFWRHLARLKRSFILSRREVWDVTCGIRTRTWKRNTFWHRALNQLDHGAYLIMKWSFIDLNIKMPVTRKRSEIEQFWCRLTPLYWTLCALGVWNTLASQFVQISVLPYLIFYDIFVVF